MEKKTLHNIHHQHFHSILQVYLDLIMPQLVYFTSIHFTLVYSTLLCAIYIHIPIRACRESAFDISPAVPLTRPNICTPVGERFSALMFSCDTVLRRFIIIRFPNASEDNEMNDSKMKKSKCNIFIICHSIHIISEFHI